jgi:hypothetical protein
MAERCHRTLRFLSARLRRENQLKKTMLGEMSWPEAQVQLCRERVIAPRY